MHREVNGGSGFQSMDDLRVEFGLGSETLAQLITIRWPSGCIQTVPDIAADQIIEVIEECAPESLLREVYSRPVAAMFPLPVYVTAPVAGPWADPEDVITLIDSYFYQHSSDTVTIRMTKTATSVEIDW